MTPEFLKLARNGWMPNNDRYPILLYRGAITGPPAQYVEQCEAIFTRNGWPAQWRNGVYDFHHYHSTAHEALGFVRGRARIVLGGEGAVAIEVKAGDVAVLPAGTGHCRIDSDATFLVVGAYPKGQDWDLCRTAATPEILERIRRVPVPTIDPLGTKMADVWKP